MKKLLIIFMVFAVSSIAQAMVLEVGPAGSGVGVLGDVYPTIQAAIGDALPGDTINIASGTYEEDLVINKENLTLISKNGPATTIIQGVSNVDSAQWPLAVANIEIIADGVQISGFTIRGPDPVSGKYSSGMVIGANSVTIEDNIFQVTNASSLDDISQGMQTYRDGNGGAGSLNSLLIRNNTFEPWGAGTHGYEAIFINHTPDDPTPSTFITIRNNVIGGAVVRGITTERSRVIIMDNTVETTLEPFDGSVGAFQGILVQDFSGREQKVVAVTNNTIQGSSGFSQAIRVGASSQLLSNISIKNNTITSAKVGVQVRGSAGGVIVNNNKIFGNTDYGIQNTDVAVLDATLNWWGDLTGPYHPVTNPAGLGNQVSDNVDFDPWYTSEDMVNPVVVYIDDTMDIRAYADTIQAGIDAAYDGDTIFVSNGTYTEALSIAGKGLKIAGESESGVIVQAAESQTGDNNVFTINADGNDITIQYVTIRYGDYGIRSSAGNVNVLNCTLYHNGWDGTNLPNPDVNTPEDFQIFWNAYATDGGAMRIENSNSSEIAYCTIYENDRGIRFQDGANGNIHNNVSHDNLESGIYLAASSYTGATGCADTDVNDNESYNNMNNGILSIGGINNTIRNNNIHDNWNSGVMLWHVAENTIQNNTINNNDLYAFNGEGKSGDAYGGVYAEGSDIAAGASFVFKLISNTISNNQTGAAAQAIGLRLDETLPAAGIDVSDNAFTNHEVDIHIRSQAATTIVSCNRFDGSGIGILNDDVSAVLNAENNWWGDASGPSGEGGGSGDAVSANVDFFPWLLSETCDDFTVVEADIVVDDDWVGFPDWTTVTVGGNDYYIGLNAFATIQEALDVVAEGQVIAVQEGTYDEDLVMDTNDVELVAAGTTIKGVATEPWPSWPLATANINILANNVKIHGFTIESPDVPDGRYSSGMVINGTNIEIYDNDFVMLSTGDAGDPGGGVAIQTYRDEVLGYPSDISGLNIHDNTFSGTPGGTYVGVFINHTLTDSETVTIQDNAFEGNVYQGVVTERSNTVIRRNHIETKLNYAGYGIIVMDWNARDQNSVEIVCNTITGDPNGFGRGILVGNSDHTQQLSDVVITNNTVQSNAIGIQVRSSADGVKVNYNSISGNDANGVENLDPASILDAKRNWWGDASGPSGAGAGSGDGISTNADYDPWLTIPASISYCPSSCPAGDLDFDCDVDFADVAILANNWLVGTEPE